MTWRFRLHHHACVSNDVDSKLVSVGGHVKTERSSGNQNLLALKIYDAVSVQHPGSVQQSADERISTI